MMRKYICESGCVLRVYLGVDAFRVMVILRT